MTTPAAEGPGATFGKYRIEEKIGQGGMGDVYLAYDPQLDRRVAIKMLQLKDDEAKRRFAAEARASAKLKHPNILPVYEIGELGSYHYFAMEYVPGRSLESMLRDHPGGVEPKKLAGIMKAVAAAVAYAHEQGVVHRDIKPANILIHNDGTPYLMDFGIAKEITKTDRLMTITGTILGTPDYMSPEQAKALKGKIREPSDIFSFGATLYHSLTGRLPFGGGELYEILDAVVNRDPLAPRSLSSAIPPELETICLRCLEKDPEARYPSARMLEEDLARFLESQPIHARPVGAFTKLLRASKRNKLASLSITGAAILLVAVIAVAVMTSGGARKKEAELFVQLAANVEKLLAEKRFSEAMSVVESFKATDLDTKASAKGLVEKINKRAGQELEALRDELDKFSGQEDLHTKFNTLLKYEKAISANPRSPEAYIYRGSVRAKFGDSKGAIEDSDTAVKLNPRLSLGYFGRAIIRSNLGDKKGALADYDKAIGIDPEFVDAYSNRGVVKSDLGDTRGAIADYDKTIGIAPGYAIAYNNRGTAKWNLGDKKGALADYGKAIGIDPVYADAYSNLGVVKSDLGDKRGAIAAYDKAIGIAPGYAYAYNNRGAAKWGLGDKKGAIADYDKALQLDPKYMDAYSNRAVAKASLGDTKGALADYDGTVRLVPKRAAAYSNRGFAKYQFQDLRGAVADWKKAIELEPSSEASLLPWIYRATAELVTAPPRAER